MAGMDVRFINPFIAATRHVFRTMLSTDVVIGRPFLKKAGDPAAEVAAAIQLSGEVVGCVSLCFGVAAAEKMASAFAKTELNCRDADFSDALGELANMVAGQAKAHLESLHTTMSLPSVMVGGASVASLHQGHLRLGLPCDSSLGRFTVEVSMEVGESVVHVPATGKPFS